MKLAGSGTHFLQSSELALKKVQLELGGNPPDIIFADADLDKAVPGASMGVFANSGQICFAGTRVFVQRSIVGEFCERAAEFAGTIRVGSSLDPNAQLGPIISARQLNQVQTYIGLGSKEGARRVCGGERLGGALADGFFVEPTIFAEVSNEMRIAREEIFGPVMSIIPFDTEEDAIRLANDTIYGLGGGVWTRDLSTALRVVSKVQTGTMWVNCYGALDPMVGFGGTKQSGYGAKGGPAHIDHYLSTKVVYINT